jgi:transposase
VALRDDIRDWVLVQGRSQRSAAQHFGISRDTVAKLLHEPPEASARRYRRRSSHPAPVRDQILPYLEHWLAENQRLQRIAPKQRWTAHRMWVELCALGITVGESTVRHIVLSLRPRRQSAYVPLRFDPGERGEFDFGHAVIVEAGRQVERPFLIGRLRYSGMPFVVCLPTERQESFLYGQQLAFAFWGGVPRTVVYDNLKPAVLALLRGHTRTEQEAFTHFRSVYRFEAIFTNPAAGWEKGSVENLVGYARRTFLVPIPEVASLEELNTRLLDACRGEQARTMAGKTTSIGDLFTEEHAQLLPLPSFQPEIGLLREVIVRKTGHIQFQTNRYSVPVRYVGHRLTLRADPFRVRVSAGEECVADHARSYERHQVIEDFRHYVPLLVEKPFAVPFASALRDAGLPPHWEAFRQDLVARRPDGNREFARILHLCLTYSTEQVGAALELAAASGAFSADAVRQLLRWADDAAQPPTPLDPERYPGYVSQQPVPDLTSYNRLLPGMREQHS